MDPIAEFGLSAWTAPTADTEIGERASSIAAVADAEARFRTLFDHSPLLIAIFDPDGSMRAVNPTLEQTLGVSAADLSDYNVLADPGPESQLRTIFRRAAAGESPIATTLRAANPATGTPQGPSIEVIGIPMRDATGDLTRVVVIGQNVTGRAKAERALQRRTNELESLLLSAPLGVAAFDREHRFQRVNQGLADISGIPAGDFAGRAIDQMLPHNADLVRAVLTQVFDTGQVVRDVELVGATVRDPQTPRRWLSSFFPVTNASDEVETVGAWVVDISERAHAEAQARESEARFRAIFEQAAVGIARLDLQGRFLEVNARWTVITGHARETLLAGDFQQITLPDDLDADMAHMADLLAGRADSYTMEKRYLSPAGEIVWVNLAVAVVRDESGEPDYFISVIEDISGRKSAEAALALSRAQLVEANARLEERIAARTAELQRTNERLTAEIERREVAQAALAQAQKLEALGQLTSGIAHDFNNVIAAISSGYSVIARRTSDPKVIEIAEHGVKAAERGAAIIRQLLAFARQEVLEPRVVSLKDVLTEAEPLIRHSLIPGVSLRIECPETLPPVRVDPSQLETALINLAVNARDAMPDGGVLGFDVAMSLPDAPDRPHELAGVEAVALAVSDTGCGIAPEVLQRVIEPFFTTKGPGKGTGLGLAMVHGFAHQSGGALRIESREGAGTTVTIYLPLVQDAAPKDLKPAPREGLDAAPRGSASLLVVDDDAGVRAVTTALLRDCGYAVREADGAAAALKIVRSTGTLQAVVSDVVMPDVDGPTMMAELRRVRPGLPVLFMTGHADRDRLGGEAVIAKPFTPDSLARAIAHVLMTASGDQPLAPSRKSVNPAGA